MRVRRYMPLQVLLGQVKEMREQSAVERALARNPLQQQRAQVSLHFPRGARSCPGCAKSSAGQAL